MSTPLKIQLSLFIFKSRNINHEQIVPQPRLSLLVDRQRDVDISSANAYFPSDITSISLARGFAV